MRSFDEILAKIAHDNGTTPEDVLHEMQVAIDDAYDHHDQEAQQLWDRMTFKGDRPTPVNSGCTATLARRFSHGVTGF